MYNIFQRRLLFYYVYICICIFIVEMDCCDQDFMQENLQNAMDCFNKVNTKPPELKCKPEEVSTE